MTWRHPHSYLWHDGHTGHHLDDNRLLVKADDDNKPRLHSGDLAEHEAKKLASWWNANHEDNFVVEPHTNMRPAGGRPRFKVMRHKKLVKADPVQPHPHMDAPPKNDQAAGAGVSTYAKFAHPYGTITPGANTDLLHYDYRGRLPQIEDLVKKHGYNVYYAGGKYGKPDLANRNYNTNHLMVYDPTPGSGGDSGEEEYTKGWRQIHELAHALTYPELNKIYGEGRRMGKLGTHRSLNEAMRAVHWEHLAAHKQRELSKQIGIHIPDHVFNKEYNTVMHDALHRAVTGKFTEPSQEGFEPHGHQLPLTHALDTLREEAGAMGLKGPHAVLARKSEQVISMTYRSDNVADETFNDQDTIELAKAYLAKRTGELAKNLKDWQERELKKNEQPGYHEFRTKSPAGSPGATCSSCGKASSHSSHTKSPEVKETNNRAIGTGERTWEAVKKAIIPPHKHSLGTTASAGVEDVPPGKENPPGKLDSIKAEETPGESHAPSEEPSAGVLCKLCKKTHAMKKGCGLTKEMLYDPKGKEVDSGINPKSTLPDDKKEKELDVPGSGGSITKKSVADIRSLAKANPPMAKPPSGKNMATAVPMSKDVKEMIVHNSTPVKPPKDADFKSKKEGKNAVYTTKAGLDPNAQMKSHALAAAGGPSVAPAAPQVKLPTPDEHAARAAAFSAATPGAGVTGHQMPGPKRPGIFGRLNKSEDLAKASSSTATLTQGMPKLKPAGQTMAPATGVGAAPTMPTGSLGPTTVKAPGATPNLPGYRTPKMPNQPPVLTQGMPKLKPAGMGLAPAFGAGPSAKPTIGARPALVSPNTTTKPSAQESTGVVAPPAAAAKFGGPVPQMPKPISSQAATRPDTATKK